MLRKSRTLVGRTPTSREVRSLEKTRHSFHGQTQVYGCEGRVERTHKGVERLVDLVTKVVMDHAVLPLDLGDDLPDGGVETCRPLVQTPP